MVLASKPVASVMRLAARPVGAQSDRLTPLAARMRKIELTMVVLPTPGPPVMTSTLDSRARRIAAIWLSASDKPVFCSIHGSALSGSMQGQGSVPLTKPQYPLGNHLLGPVQAGQKDAGSLADRVGDDRSLGQFQIERRPDQLRRDFEQLDGKRHQLLGGQAAMALVHRLGQRIGDPGAHPDHRRLLDAELHGDGIGGLEADAADVARQPIRVLGHDLDGIAAVGLVDPNRTGGADAMAVQEDHDLAHDLLLGPGVGDALGAHRADAGHLAQTIAARPRSYRTLSRRTP